MKAPPENRTTPAPRGPRGGGGRGGGEGGGQADIEAVAVGGGDEVAARKQNDADAVRPRRAGDDAEDVLPRRSVRDGKLVPRVDHEAPLPAASAAVAASSHCAVVSTSTAPQPAEWSTKCHTGACSREMTSTAHPAASAAALKSARPASAPTVRPRRTTRRRCRPERPSASAARMTLW